VSIFARLYSKKRISNYLYLMTAVGVRDFLSFSLCG
jgi:hypothetical protein